MAMFALRIPDEVLDGATGIARSRGVPTGALMRQ